MGRNLRVDVRSAEERTLTVSSPGGGCLVSIRDDDGRLRIEVYRADDTVDVIVPKGARMTKYEYVIQGDYAHGWEDVHTEPTRAGALVQVRLYREADAGTAFRIRKRRVES
jgi:hypothetical protein